MGCSRGGCRPAEGWPAGRRRRRRRRRVGRVRGGAAVARAAHVAHVALAVAALARCGVTENVAWTIPEGRREREGRGGPRHSPAAVQRRLTRASATSTASFSAASCAGSIDDCCWSASGSGVSAGTLQSTTTACARAHATSARVAAGRDPGRDATPRRQFGALQKLRTGARARARLGAGCSTRRVPLHPHNRPRKKRVPTAAAIS